MKESKVEVSNRGICGIVEEGESGRLNDLKSAKVGKWESVKILGKVDNWKGDRMEKQKSGNVE